MSRPMRASSGVIVRPIAVTICQKAAVLGRISCACAAVASTISVVSDGDDISSPVSAATPALRAAEPQQRRRDDRLGRDHAGHGGEQRLPVLRDHPQIEAHADGDEEHAEREALERRGDHLDLGMIVGLGDQQPGEQRADDRRQADGGGRDARQDHDEQAGGEEQLRALGARRLREQARQQQPAEHEHHDDRQPALPQRAQDAVPPGIGRRWGRARRARR